MLSNTRLECSTYDAINPSCRHDRLKPLDWLACISPASKFGRMVVENTGIQVSRVLYTKHSVEKRTLIQVTAMIDLGCLMVSKSLDQIRSLALFARGCPLCPSILGLRLQERSCAMLITPCVRITLFRSAHDHSLYRQFFRLRANQEPLMHISRTHRLVPAGIGWQVKQLIALSLGLVLIGHVASAWHLPRHLVQSFLPRNHEHPSNSGMQLTTYSERTR